jgi:hypothetical protein
MDAIDLLQKDYELKTDYLTAHFSRMWTRFNFFLTIESALLAFSLDKDIAPYAGYMALAGFFLSLLWYWFAATDNFLVLVYRGQVAHVFELMRGEREKIFEKHGLNPNPEGYSHVGSVSNEGFNPKTGRVEPIKRNFWQWRFQKVSVTEMGVVFALLFALLWVGRFILTLTHPIA